MLSILFDKANMLTDKIKMEIYVFSRYALGHLFLLPYAYTQSLLIAYLNAHTSLLYACVLYTFVVGTARVKSKHIF